jgi:AhpD family alkylhydroperoxidase
LGEDLNQFQEFRKRMNEKILASGNLEIKRFFSLDKNAYKAGALPSETKELLGLVASIVLRCNDCINYHILQSVKLGVTDEQFFEVFNVALVVGGSIVIPHMRRAVAFLEEVRRDS